MRKFLGKLGGAFSGPHPRAVTLFLLISASIFLALPETASAQIWVSSGFKAGSDAQHITAYCSTSAVDPNDSFSVTPAATDYATFSAQCRVTSSTGLTTYIPACEWSEVQNMLFIPNGFPAGTPATGNPTGICSIDLPVVVGVTYKVESYHYLSFIGPQYPCDDIGGSIGAFCWPDPEGFWAQGAIYWTPLWETPLPGPSGPPLAGTITLPAYTTNQSSIVHEEMGSEVGTGTNQGTASPYSYEGEIWFMNVSVLGIATTSAMYTACPVPTITSISPSTWPEGTVNVVTITGTGFTTTANATASCSVTPLAVGVGTGSVSVTGVQVDSSTSISFIERPDANDPTETATITVGASPNTATTTAQIEGCTLPTAESTAFKGWSTSDPATGLWEQTLSNANGDSFSGMNVLEGTPRTSSGVDTCWISGSPVNYGSAVSGGKWPVGDDNTWGTDSVGWPKYPVDAVAYYRAQGRAPCGFTIYQQMQIQCTLPTDNTFHNYGPVNILQGNITATTVTSKRAGGTASRRY
jgi:hypothetical protein